MESMENHHQLLVGPLSMGAPILMQIHPTFRQVLISRILILARDVATVLGSLFKGTTVRRCDQFQKWNV